jgi:hypothetical protein
MKDEAAVKSISMSDFLRSISVEQKRALYSAAAAKAMDSQKRVIEAAKALQAQ